MAMLKPHQTEETSKLGVNALGPVRVEAAPLRQRVTAELRRAIELGTLAAGERLIEKDLCARLGVSRPLLREALRDLEVNGIIKNVPPRGMVVAQLSREEIISIYRIRGAIELLLAEEFVKHATEEDLAALRAAVKEIKAGTSSWAATLDAHRLYYDALCRGASDAFAFEFLRNIQLRIAVLRSRTLTPEYLRKNAAGREEIVRCMAKRDTAASQRAIRTHMAFALNAALEGAGFRPADPES
jgi:DNA-binding GntR family transcriptional regulator